MADNIIHSFQQRRQLTQEIAALAQTQSEAELMERVRQLVRDHPADLLASMVIKHLETTNSQLRGGLGHIASLLPPEEIGPLLRSAAANRSNGAQMRVTAALILERFLGETLSPAILNDLSQTNEVAFQSLREAVEEGERNRHVLLEYVTQMHQTNEQIALMVLDLVGRLEPDARVDFYRLLCQEEWPVVAHAALPKLEKLAAENDRALAALHTLRFMLAPDEAEQVTRALRKFQFTGRHYTPPSPEGWRALMSPADIGGSYSIWFVKGPSEGRAEIVDGVLMGMVINHRLGVLQTFGSETLPTDQLPSPHPIGQLATVRSDHGQSAVLLEIPFEVGRWLLAQAHTAHWAAVPLRPLPGEYQLYGDRLWAFAAPEIDPTLGAYFSEDESPLPPADALDKAAELLLAHPAFDGWSFNNRLLLHSLGAVGSSLAQLPMEEVAMVMLRELSQRAEYVQLLSALSAALRAQAVWLHIAGNLESAQRAHLLARTMSQLPPSQNPLLLRLLVAGLRPS